MWLSCLAAILLALTFNSEIQATQQKIPPPAGEISGKDRGIDPLKNYWGDLDGFFDRQAQASLDLLDEILVKYPPGSPERSERKLALLMIDTILHDPKAPERSAVQEFFRQRIQKATAKLEETNLEAGAMIWKLYNHSFVVRTRSITLGFDLVRAHSAGKERFVIEDEVMKRIVNQCDILFVSHVHPDHADSFVARAFLDQGKTVVAPDGVWAAEQFYSKIMHLDRDPNRIHEVSVKKGQAILKVVLYPGHQGQNILNNVALISTPEGLSFAQTGDQSNPEDFKWIDEVGRHHRVDILMPNCWTTDIARVIRGFKPAVVITGHENELGHTVDHREPFWLSYDRLQKSTAPALLMAWGEAYHYKPTPR